MKKAILLVWILVVPFVLFWMGFGGRTPAGQEIAAIACEAHKLNIKAASPSAVGTYRFVAFGDWGAGTPFQRDIAKQLKDLYAKKPFESALLLGDNIYEHGDVEKHGKAYFTDMYAPLIQGNVHFIVALGNHDVRFGHGDDQVKFFKMPGYFYQVCKPNVDIFVLNTNTFANDQVQQKWLAKALAASKASWKIVMGHHPIYTSGEHGSNAGLKKTLEPLLVKHNVNLYLAGHDHDYERFKPSQGVLHIVSGGGGAYLRDFEKVLPNSQVRHKAHHFLSFEADQHALNMWAIDKTGKTIDHVQLAKAKPQNQKIPMLSR